MHEFEALYVDYWLAKHFKLAEFLKKNKNAYKNLQGKMLISKHINQKKGIHNDFENKTSLNVYKNTK